MRLSAGLLSVVRGQSSFGSVIDGFIDLSSSSYKKRFHQNVNSLEVRQVAELKEWAKNDDNEALVQKGLKRNKLTVRNRMRYLLDEGTSLLEIGLLAGSQVDYGPLRAASCVVGLGRISGRICMVTCNDWSVKGGTIYPIGVKKQLRAQDIARRLRIPSVYLVDSGGAFLPLQAEIFPDKYDGGRGFYNQATMGADGIPQIAVVLGSCTAGGAYVPTLSDDCVIVSGNGSLFLGGPPLVKAALGEQNTAEQLGGADLHCRLSGCTDYMSHNEHEALSLVRSVVKCTNAPLAPKLDRQKCPAFSLIEILPPNHTNHMKQIIARIVDSSEIVEFRELYGSNSICGFARIAGVNVGILAGTGKALDRRSAEKAAQFVQMCDLRLTPIVVMQNCTQPSQHSNSVETMKARAQLMSVFASVTCHVISIDIGGCIADDYYAMCGRSFDPTFYFAWPQAKLAMTHECPPMSSLTAADRMWIDDVIEPKDTREVLISCLEAINSGVPERKGRFTSIKI